MTLVCNFNLNIVNVSDSCYNLLDNPIYVKKDTMHIPFWVVNYAHKDYSCDIRNNWYTIDNTPVDSLKWYSEATLTDSAINYLDKATRHYCFFYSEDGKVNRKGILTVEFDIIGKTSIYYDTGEIESEGKLSDNICLVGQKIGAWRYYNKKGKVIKIEEYDTKGVLLKTKKIK